MKLLNRSAPLVGQIALSAVSFSTAITSVRVLGVHEYSTIALLAVIFFVLLSAQRGVLLEQLLIIGKTDIEVDLESIARTSGYVIALVFSAVSFTVASAGRTTLLMVPILLFYALLLAYDAIRYSALGGGDLSRLVTCDIAIAITSCAIMVTTFVSPTVTHWLIYLLPTALAVATLALTKLSLAFSVPKLWSFIRSLGSFTPWLLIQTVILNAAAQLGPLLLAPLLGPAAFAGLRATVSTLTPLNIVATAMQPTLVHAAAKTRGDLQPYNFIGRSLRWLLPISLLFVIVALVAKETIVERLLPEPYHDAAGILFLPVLLSIILPYIGLPGGVLLRYYRLGVQSAIAQATAVAIGLPNMLILAHRWGVEGAGYGLLVQASLSVIFGYILLVRAVKRSGPPSHSRDPNSDAVPGGV